jgi:threonine dehydrogenase-like Zn-dependent dehydrogenase
VRLLLTHLLAYEIGGTGRPARDGVGRVPPAAADGPETHYFIPGQLPCGACALCRRGLTAACPSAMSTIPAEPEAAALDLPERFLTPIDHAGAPGPLPPEVAAGAGLVAFAIQAVAAANLTAGDLAIWIGGGPVADVGGQLTAGRGARTVMLGATPARAGLERFDSAAQALPALAQEPSSAESAHQRSTRRLFLTRTDGATLRAASQMADAGAVLVLMGPGSSRLGGDLELPPEARLACVGGYHPDLVPEALALLRRGELQVPAARPLAP